MCVYLCMCLQFNYIEKHVWIFVVAWFFCLFANTMRVFFSVAVSYNLISGMEILLEVILIFRIVLAILGFLFFHIKLRLLLSRSVKNCAGILMEITLMLIAFCRMAIFSMLILLILEHERSFLLHQNNLSFYFLLQNSFLSHRSLTCFVRVSSRCMILFEIIVKSVVSLISFSDCSSFVHRRSICFSFVCLFLS